MKFNIVTKSRLSDHKTKSSIILYSHQRVKYRSREYYHGHLGPSYTQLMMYSRTEFCHRNVRKTIIKYICCEYEQCITCHYVELVWYILQMEYRRGILIINQTLETWTKRKGYYLFNGTELQGRKGKKTLYQL